MPGGAAGGDDHAVHARQFIELAGHAVEARRAAVEVEAPARGHADGGGLLEDLLEHEVRIAALLDLLEVPRDLVDRLVHVGVLEIAHGVAVTGEGDHLAVVEIDDPARMADDGGGVDGHLELAVVEHEQPGRPLTGG